MAAIGPSGVSGGADRPGFGDGGTGAGALGRWRQPGQPPARPPMVHTVVVSTARHAIEWAYDPSLAGRIRALSRR